MVSLSLSFSLFKLLLECNYCKCDKKKKRCCNLYHNHIYICDYIVHDPKLGYIFFIFIIRLNFVFGYLYINLSNYSSTSLSWGNRESMFSPAAGS